MPKLLLTGATGFIGRRLLPRISGRYPDLEIVTLSRSSSPGETMGDTVNAEVLDIRDRDAVKRMAERLRPDLVVHLAAQSSVAVGASAPEEVWEANFTGTVNLAEAVRAVRPDAGFLFASSAEVYGSAFERGEVLDESSPLGPKNAYARSKAAAEFALQDVWSDTGKLCVLRIFNHLGAGQDERFVASSFAAQIARIEAGLLPPVIRVGDLSAERDFGDVEDLVDALELVVGSIQALPAKSVFNICSGRSRPVSDVLDGLISVARVKPEVVIDPERFRPNELRRAAATSAAVEKALGWRPKRELSVTLANLLEDWRRRVGAQA